MIIDSHNHVGLDKDGSSQSAEELLVSMRQYGIDYAVIFPFDEKTDLIEASINLLGKSDKLIPFLRFDPKMMTVDKLTVLMKKFHGVKLHPRAQEFNPLNKTFFDLYGVIEKSKKPLFIHSRKYYNKDSDPDILVTLSDHFPNLNIILAHFASFSPVALEYVKKKDNLFIETSTVQSHRLLALGCSRIGSTK